ncbi:CvpA family protein [Labrys wisconsinensis]|uniref:Membrane protein required for colicin V production n=1 Tax=Labrys wisconsinensis TaxID=425677 RepID=A0ABU0J462_9HYPH|nr:CvpA family protein [Labrys wisconsinensis]MDQ0469061.1 membrane protein required for colicin V production [Labrys wisconsinensis]
MPVTLLDLIVVGVMLISALLAMVRGFTREVLSIAAWVAAAAAALLLFQHVQPFLDPYIKNPTVAQLASGAAVFLVTLIVVSFITIRISDMILDSRIGAIDRTLGFIFGAARGLLLAIVAFLFFAWLVPDKSQPVWVQDAKSKQLLLSGGSWLMGLLPSDPESTILKRLRAQDLLPGDNQDADPDAAPPQPSAPQTQPAEPAPAPTPPAKPAPAN